MNKPKVLRGLAQKGRWTGVDVRYSKICLDKLGHLIRWTTVRRRLRLNAPQHPTSGEIHGRLWLWLLPITIVSVVWDIVFTPSVSQLWTSFFPFLAEPPGYGFDRSFESPEILDRLVGAWWFFGLFVLSTIFNSILGEEILFRGVLLPKMGGLFGRWSWPANGVLFGFYHVHQPWGIVGNVISGAFFLALPSWRFRSTWMGVIVHSVQNVFFAFLILGVVPGLA